MDYLPATLGCGSATLRSGLVTCDTNKIYIYIYIYIIFFFEYPLKKFWEHPQIFFDANKIKFGFIICSTFKQKEKAQKKF